MDNQPITKNEEIEQGNNLLIWECGNGHQWKARVSNVKYNKKGCPMCPGNKKLDISMYKSSTN